MLNGIIRFRKVEEATTSKDEPTQIYLLEEVVKASQSSPEDAQHIVEHLLRKLDSKNPVVKAKALRACKYLVLHGAIDARRILQRTSAPIRNLQTYRGPPDALKGDALNERVRVSAKEAIDAIFSTETVSQPVSKMTSNSSSRIQGFGNQSNVMQPPYRPEHPPQGVHFSKDPDSFLREIPSVDSDSGNRVQTNAKSINVLGDEEEVVDSICQPSGMRLAPAKEDIRKFIDTVGSLDGPRVARQLQKKVEGGPWQQSYRALCLIEAILLQGSSLSCGEIGVHFQGDLDIIRRCAANTVQSSVRERANRILSIFTEVDNDDNHQTQTIEASTQSPEVDLLLDIETPPPAPVQSDPILSVPVQSDPILSVPVQSDPVLGGLDDLEVQPVTTGGDMFSGLSLSDTTQQGKESNEHLAALLAPSPPSDPFPQGIAPVQTETQKVEPLLQNPPPGFQVPPMMQQPMMGFGMTYPVQPMMNPGPYFMQQMPQQGTLPPQGPPGVDGRGEVPLSAFVGRAHTERRDSGGKNNPAFGFIGDHMTQLRGKK